MKVLKSKKIIALLIIALAAASYLAWQNYQSSRYLKISEWGVTLPISAPIRGATYHLNADGNLAFLSTKSLDSSSTCQNYYQKQQGQLYFYPSYQYITRLAPGDVTVPSPKTPALSARQATIKYPKNYLAIGKYVYEYGQGNGQPCAQHDLTMTNAFYYAFLGLR